MSINLRQKAITWKHHPSLIVSNRFSEHLEVKTCFSYHKKQKAAQGKMPSWPQLRTKKPGHHSPHEQCLSAGVRHDEAGETLHIKLSHQNHWGKGLTVEQQRFEDQFLLFYVIPLEEQWWRWGCDPQPLCFQKVDKRENTNASCWTVSAGLEQRWGGRRDQKPSRPSL